MTTPFSRTSLYISIIYVIIQRRIVQEVLTPNFNSLCLSPKTKFIISTVFLTLTTHRVYEPPLTLKINNASISLSSINWLVCVIHMDRALWGSDLICMYYLDQAISTSIKSTVTENESSCCQDLHEWLPLLDTLRTRWSKSIRAPDDKLRGF